ncbi:MAG: alpha/beta fold hydrolase [Planctomycetota bacterium]|jgi:pimeloyl-ACP methyl ester carboxylesterase
MLHEQIYEVGRTAWNIAVGPDHGVPLIFFHGVTRRWQSFLPLLPSLMLRHQVFVVDFPGHGLSDRLSGRYRVIDYVDAAEALLSTPPFSHQKRCVLYGHSLGSMVVADLAGRLGERVQGVVMEDPPFDTMGTRIHETPLLSFFTAMQQFAGSNDSVAAIAERLADVTLTDPQSQQQTRLGDVRDAASLRFTARCLQQLDPRTLDVIVDGQWLESFDWQQALRDLPCPGLLLQADQSSGGMLTDQDADLATELAADLTRIRYEATGHLIHWQQTSALLRHVEACLEAL